MNSLLKHAIGLTASIALFASVAPKAHSLPLNNLKFAQGSYCGSAASANSWYSFKAAKGQRVAIQTTVGAYNVIELRVYNMTTGKRVKLSQHIDEYDQEISTFITAGNNQYRVEFWWLEAYQPYQTTTPFQVCIK